MKQILQSLKDGRTEVADVPVPSVRPGCVLIRSSTSLISAGTERMLVSFGKSNYLNKARSQPDKVREVIDKVKNDGVLATYEAVQSKLETPLPLGYCNCGYVVGVGDGVDEFSIGDRVVSNGFHAEFVSVPKNLCAKVPTGVSDEDACFTVAAAIGLQGIRLAEPAIGECVVVIGLGLIGLLTVQMLRAQGCIVLGVDFEEDRLQLARIYGAETVTADDGDAIEEKVATLSRGIGADAVIITASTASNDPIKQAANVSRKRGKIVLVGVVGLELARSDFYEKELTFQVSCSYGPGRYDPSYEEGGNDYPVGFVRWTEQRNFMAVLDLLASGRIEVGKLVTHRFKIDNGDAAMDLLMANSSSLGIVLQYPESATAMSEGSAQRVLLHDADVTQQSDTSLAFLGAGNYAGRILIPAFARGGAHLHTLVSAGGVSSVHFGSKHGFLEATTDGQSVMNDERINIVAIATRHHLHSEQILSSLRSGKHVFCEKPLCINLDELGEIEKEASSRPNQHLMIGFNRRFAPLVIKMKSLLSDIDQPKTVVMTINAGEIEPDHWTQDPTIGGGRIVGECCHFIDLARFLVGASVCDWSATAIGDHPAIDIKDDKVSITLRFQDGSFAVINYLSNGHKSVPKERLEVFTAGRVLKLENFRTLKGYGWNGFKKLSNFKQDKGQNNCVAAFMSSVRSGESTPIPRAEIFESSRLAIEIADSVR